MTLTESSRAALEQRYDQAAMDYMASLPLEHYMESTPHATQRKITLESLDLVSARRSDVHVFNELLVLYPLPRRKTLGHVVPDNMVVLSAKPIASMWSYNVPLQPVRPFWMLEYVSKRNKRKDYVDNMRRYERDLKVPYYLLFDTDKQTLTLYQLNTKRYQATEPNDLGRLVIPELDLEMAILDRWVRFWYKRKLLPLPADMQKEVDALSLEVAELRKQLAKLQAKKNGKH